jgi:hypothetical protein
MAEGLSAFLLASTASGFEERPQCGAGLRRDRSLSLGVSSRRNVRMPGKAGINHATPLHRMEAMRLIVQRRWPVSVWSHQQCSCAGTCSFCFPFNAVRLTLRTPGLATFINNPFFPDRRSANAAAFYCRRSQSIAACQYRPCHALIITTGGPQGQPRPQLFSFSSFFGSF